MKVLERKRIYSICCILVYNAFIIYYMMKNLNFIRPCKFWRNCLCVSKWSKNIQFNIHHVVLLVLIIKFVYCILSKFTRLFLIHESSLQELNFIFCLIDVKFIKNLTMYYLLYTYVSKCRSTSIFKPNYWW